MKIFVSLLLASVLAGAMANDELCRGMPENSFVAFPGDCQRYILCQKERAIENKCPQPVNQPEIWFNPIKQQCAPKGDFCRPPPCIGLTGVFVEEGTACGGWIYCLNGEESHGAVCPNNLSFVRNLQACTYPLCAKAPVESDVSPVVVL